MPVHDHVDLKEKTVEHVDIERIGRVCGSIASWVCGRHPKYRSTPVYAVQARAGLFGGMLGVPAEEWPVVHAATAEAIKNPRDLPDSDTVRVKQLAAAVGLESLALDLATYLFTKEEYLEAFDRERGWGLAAALAKLEGVVDEMDAELQSPESISKHFPEHFPEISPVD
jgi:hypothetical protein